MLTRNSLPVVRLPSLALVKLDLPCLVPTILKLRSWGHLWIARPSFTSASEATSQLGRISRQVLFGENEAVRRALVGGDHTVFLRHALVARDV